MTLSRLILPALVAAPLLLLSAPAPAASSYDACSNTINSLPAVINTQGVWCFKQDLATAINTGNAITINNNNVTIDCNGFKLGGLGAGPATTAFGIYANGRSNVSVRDCNIRGFLVGLALEGSSGGGHRVERNRFEGNHGAGLSVVGDGSLVRDNLVVDTGGANLPPGANYAGIAVTGAVDVIGNQVIGVDATLPAGAYAIGILVGQPSGSSIRDNRVSKLFPNDTDGLAIGIGALTSGPLDVRDNTLSNEIFGYAVACSGAEQVLHGNALLMGEPSASCVDGGANYGIP